MAKMATTMAACAAIMILVITMEPLAATSVTFTASPTTSEIIPGLTYDLNMTCDVTDAATAATLTSPATTGSSLVGRRRRDGSNLAADSTIKYLTSVVVVRGAGNDHVAAITEHTPAVGNLDPDNLQVKGQITGSEGSLQLQWSYPTKDQLGGYVCEVNGLTSEGHGVVITKTLEVGLGTPNVSTLVEHISGLKKQNDRQLEVNADIRQKNKDQEHEIAMLNTKTANQENEIASLKTETSNQDQRIADLETTNDQQKSEITMLNTKTANQENEISSLKTENSNQDHQIADLKTTNDQQKSEITSLKTTVTSQEQKLSALQTKTNLQEQQITNLKHVESGTIDCGSAGESNPRTWTGRISSKIGTDMYLLKTVRFSKSYPRSPVVHLSTAFIFSDKEDDVYHNLDLASVTSDGFSVRCRTYNSAIGRINDWTATWISVPR